MAEYQLFFVGLRLFYTLVRVRAVIHFIWTNGKEQAPYIAPQKDQ